jgi:chromate transport protein ChrA
LEIGDPAALAGYTHRDLVDDKKWISEEDYKEGLAFCYSHKYQKYLSGC